eukprot:g5084.t1
MAEVPLTSFADARWAWHNGEPPSWSVENGGKGLHVEPKPGLDYWSRTFYGPELLVKSDAPSLVAKVAPGHEATLTTAFTLYPRAQFDQAGVMVLVEDGKEGEMGISAWVKAGIEFTDGHPNLSCVCTNDGFSDWSTQRIVCDAGTATPQVSMRVRVTKHLPGLEQGPCITMEACAFQQGDTADSPGDWRQVRIASLRGRQGHEQKWKMGIFSISPVAQEGSYVKFHHIKLGPKVQPVHNPVL